MRHVNKDLEAIFGPNSCGSDDSCSQHSSLDDPTVEGDDALSDSTDSTETSKNSLSLDCPSDTESVPNIDKLDDQLSPGDSTSADSSSQSSSENDSPIANKPASRGSRGRGRRGGSRGARGRGRPGGARTPKQTQNEPQWQAQDPKQVRMNVPQHIGPKHGMPSKEVPRGMKPSSKAIDFFELFWSKHFRSSVFVCNTNRYACFLGAGGDRWPHFKPATLHEIDILLALLLRNGLSPTPTIELMFSDPSKCFVWGDERVRNLIPYRRFKELRSLFHIQDPTTQPDGPLHKLNPMLQRTRERCERLWIVGPNVALDEQTIPFKGRCSLKQRIKYKREGDGFLCDALCDAGYTFTFQFRVETVKELEPSFSTLHNRCLGLLMKLPHPYTHVYMDNLYPSVKWASILRRKYKVLICGVIRKGGRGVPVEVMQTEIVSKKKKEKVRGTVLVATRSDGVVVASVYDEKPVYMLSTAHTHVQMREKARKIWNSRSRTFTSQKFPRLNLIDDYNKHTHQVDVADQLRLQYRIDHKWFRVRKWWWSIFLWCFGMVCVNAYLIYKAICKAAKSKPKSRAAFLADLARDLAHPPSNLKRKRPNEISVGNKKRCYSARITSTTLKFFPGTEVMHEMADVPVEPRTYCQWCRYSTQQQTTARIRCVTCSVSVCSPSCWNKFHASR